MSLEGKIAMVTGAATGIGAILALALALSEARVIGVDIKWDGAEKTVGGTGSMRRRRPGER